MNVQFRRSFDRDLKSISDRSLRDRVAAAIESVRQAETLSSVRNLKQLDGPYFRIRVGDYRLGIRVEGDAVMFIRCLHRREIYRFFP